jgi:CRP/FNR family transcriptional regulator, cyclic AMP receptor protein
VGRGIPTQVIRHFQAIPLFSKVSKKGIRAIVQAGTEIDVRAGRPVVTEGEFGRHLYVIVSGTATVIQKGKKLADLGPGDFFGELAFLDGAPRSATVAAKTDMTVIALGPREMDVIVDREPVIAKRLLEAMAHRVRRSGSSLSH